MPSYNLPNTLLAAVVTVCLHALLLASPAQSQQEGDTTAPLNGAALEELVGPVALYPDDLLAIVLPASAYPLQIVEAARFLEQRKSNPDAQPDDSWDDAVIALLNYPEAVTLLNQDLDWTWRLGEAFLRQEAELMAAVTRFRERAYAAGNLRTDERQVVTREERAITVTPAQREVIYVPYYRPREVLVHHTRPVYFYYLAPRPLYYYPYGSNFWLLDRGFWGVSTFFRLGWHTRHLHVFHHHHHRHPFYGTRYHRERYRSHYYRHRAAEGHRDEADNPRWRPSKHKRRFRHRWEGSRPHGGRRIQAHAAPQQEPQRGRESRPQRQFQAHAAPQRKPQQGLESTPRQQIRKHANRQRKSALSPSVRTAPIRTAPRRAIEKTPRATATRRATVPRRQFTAPRQQLRPGQVTSRSAPRTVRREPAPRVRKTPPSPARAAPRVNRHQAQRTGQRAIRVDRSHQRMAKPGRAAPGSRHGNVQRRDGSRRIQKR